MVEGASLAKELGDAGAAQWYMYQAGNISLTLDNHWSESKGFIISGYEGNNNPIRSGLDISVILAVIQTDQNDGLSFSMTDDRVLATVKPLTDSFKYIYKINSITQDAQGRPLGLAIGRYQEDTYDGVNNSKGARLKIYLFYRKPLVPYYCRHCRIHVQSLCSLQNQGSYPRDAPISLILPRLFESTLCCCRCRVHQGRRDVRSHS